MKHSDFQIGMRFRTETGVWRVTDIGTRTVVAIPVGPFLLSRTGVTGKGALAMPTITMDEVTEGQAEEQGWFAGPPYAVEEVVFDEDDFEACSPE